jgi:hypothetical protein
MAVTQSLLAPQSDASLHCTHAPLPSQTPDGQLVPIGRLVAPWQVPPLHSDCWHTPTGGQSAELEQTQFPNPLQVPPGHGVPEVV